MKKASLIFMVVLFIVLGQAQSKTDALKITLEQTSDKGIRLKVLDSLTNELVRNNSEEQVLYLEQYLTLAKDLEEFDLMASKSRFLIQDHIFRGEFEKAKQLCDSLLEFKPKFKKESSEAHLLLKRAAALYDSEDLQGAVKDYERSAALFLKSGDSIYAADAFFFGGQANTDLNNFLKAINSFKEAETLYEMLGDKEYVLLVGAELTSLYSNNGFLEKSIAERERLIAKARKYEDLTTLMLLYGQNVNTYYKQGDFEKMTSYLDDMSDLKDSFNDFYQEHFGLFMLNYRLLYACQKKDLVLATSLMKQLEDKTKTGNISKYLNSDMLEARAAYYELTRDEKKLVKVLEELSGIDNSSRFNSQTYSRQKLADIYERRGNYKRALELYKANTKIKDSIYNSQKTNAFLYYQSEFEAEQKQHELIEQDA
ncbi:MAG: hypothetical protein AAF901_05935, partial [Bacteroidota bacterium]